MTPDDDDKGPSALLPFEGTAEPSEAETMRPPILDGFSGTMRRAVLEAIIPFLSRHEGVVFHMYCDAIGLVTTGIGNLIDPVAMALVLPWRRPDGSLARQDEIAACWTLVKGRQDMRLGGGVAYKRIPGNDLRLNENGLAALVCGRLETNERILKQRFPKYDEWPAAAQLGVHSMAWAMGPHFKFPVFVAAVNADPPDFASAAIASRMRNGAPARNEAQRRLFEEAHDVVTRTGDYEGLREA